jgi:hypothetical protein
MVMAAAASMSHPLKGFNTKKQITVKPEEYVIANNHLVLQLKAE